MDDLELKIRSRYLDRLDQWDWEDEDPRLDFGSIALPYFEAAFTSEQNSERRKRLVRNIWGFRDIAALPTLAIALDDPASEVGKSRETES